MKVVPLGSPEESAQKHIGFLAGQIQIPDDFDSMSSHDIADSFQGTTSLLLLDTHLLLWAAIESAPVNPGSRHAQR